MQYLVFGFSETPTVVLGSYADPHHFDADPDLDPACYLDADPDPYSDPTFHFDADPDQDPSLQIKTNFAQIGSDSIPFDCHLQIDADPDPAYHFYTDPDQDPTFQFDTDPQHCFSALINRQWSYFVWYRYPHEITLMKI